MTTYTIPQKMSNSGTEQATIRAARASRDYSLTIIDRSGNEYVADYDRLVKL